jgi:DNA-binding MarR family transcriptional regulator
MKNHIPTLRFDGSLWCNLDIALRNIDYMYRQMIRPEGLTVIEWYILRSLYEQDGQHASELARAVGRAATSFTPNLDKLQHKGFIERRPDKADRRAVRIYLTQQGHNCRDEVIDSAGILDSYIDEHVDKDTLLRFQAALLIMQTVVLEN